MPRQLSLGVSHFQSIKPQFSRIVLSKYFQVYVDVLRGQSVMLLCLHPAMIDHGFLNEYHTLLIKIMFKTLLIGPFICAVVNLAAKSICKWRY